MTHPAELFLYFKPPLLKDTLLDTHTTAPPITIYILPTLAADKAKVLPTPKGG